MLIFKYILIVIHVMVSALLMISILLQNPKGGGLAGSMFGGAGGDVASSLFGARGAASALAKITQWLAGAFFVLSFAISMLSGGTGRVESVTQKVMQQQPNTPAANLPSVEQLGIDAGVKAGKPGDNPAAAPTPAPAQTGGQAVPDSN